MKITVLQEEGDDPRVLEVYHINGHNVQISIEQDGQDAYIDLSESDFDRFVDELTRIRNIRESLRS